MERKLTIPSEKVQSSGCVSCMGNCFYFLFCCCCCASSDQGDKKQKFKRRFTKWLERGNDGPVEDLSHNLYELMIKLYAHKEGIVEEFFNSNVRINPDFTSDFRSDLEFFIPQLCSFYISAGFEKEYGLLEFLISACNESFFFSHWLWFFF